MSDLHDKALPDRLRDAASGSIEWRVQDKDRAYCMAFSSRDTINPERAAREWFSEHSKNYPENAAKYEVARCVVLDRSDRLMIEAADTIAALLAENERLAGFVSKLHARPVGPDRCPFTGREFWGNITHPELGEVATYGGPFDTYTLPARTDDDEEYFVRRFDHDRGHWLPDDMEFIGLKLIDDQLYTSEDDPAELRARAEAAEARYKALCEAEPVAVIHADGYWTHPAGQDPFDHYKTNATRLEVIPRPSMEGGK